MWALLFCNNFLLIKILKSDKYCKYIEIVNLYLSNLDNVLLYLLNTSLTLNNSIQIEQQNNESK